MDGVQAQQAPPTQLEMKGTAENRVETVVDAGTLAWKYENDLPQRHEKNKDGRPWYVDLYEPRGTSKCFAAARWLLVPALVILPTYVIFIPCKVVSLAFFYVFLFPHLILELRDRHYRRTAPEAGAGERGGNLSWQIYKAAFGAVIFAYAYAYATLVMAPVAYTLCRVEAAAEVMAVWFIDPLEFDRGWTIPGWQLLLPRRRYNPTLMAMRRFDEAGRPQGRILIPNHEELLGLNQLPDSVFTDRFVNHMALCGYAYDKHEGRPKPYWTELATRFVYYCCSQKRMCWTSHGKYAYLLNMWLAVCNSQAASFVSIRFAIRFHPLSRNERFILIVERLALSFLFATVQAAYHEQSKAPVYGLVTFAIVFVQTRVARSTFHVGRPKACKGCGMACGACGACCSCSKCCGECCCTSEGFDVERCGECASKGFLFTSLFVILLVSVIYTSVVITSTHPNAHDKALFAKSYFQGVIVSEAVAWGIAIVLYVLSEWLEARAIRAWCAKRPKPETGAQVATGHDEWTTSLWFMERFMKDTQWPEDLMGPSAQYTPEWLLTHVHPRPLEHEGGFPVKPANAAAEANV